MQQQRLWASGANSGSPGAHLNNQHPNNHFHSHQHQNQQILFSSSNTNYHLNHTHDNDNHQQNPPSSSSSLSLSTRHHLKQIHHHAHYQNPNTTTTPTDHYLHLQPSSQILMHKHRPTSPYSNHSHHHHSQQQQQQQQRLKQIASYVEQQVAAAAATTTTSATPQQDPLNTSYQQNQQIQIQTQTQMIESPESPMGATTTPVYMQPSQQQPQLQAYAESPGQLDYATTTSYLQQKRTTTAAAIKVDTNDGPSLVSLQQQQQRQQLPVAVGPRPRVNSVSLGLAVHGGAVCGQSSSGFITRSTSFSAPRAASADHHHQQQHYGGQKIFLHHHQPQLPAATAAAAVQLGQSSHQAPIQPPALYGPTSLAPPSPVSSQDSTSQASSPISYHHHQQQPSPYSSNSGGGFTSNCANSSHATTSGSATMSPSDALNLGINLEQYISKRNERERSRVRNVNDAFDNLKNSLPLDIEKLTKRMSKVEILRTAIGYIRNLENVLGYKQQQQLAAGRTALNTNESERQQQHPPTRVDSQDSIRSCGSSSVASGNGGYSSTFPTSQPSSPPSELEQPASNLTPAVSPAISSCGSMSPPLAPLTTTASNGRTSAYLGRLQAVQTTNYCHYQDTQNQFHQLEGGHQASGPAQPHQQQEQQPEGEEGPFYYQDLMRLLENHD